MTERLYYTDAYTTQFTATIVERLRENGQLLLVLDRTYFYPTSGGQLADRGRINGEPVIDVQIREADGAVVHFLQNKEEIWTDEIKGEIAWERRFEQMQTHTGQHILSQAFMQMAQAETVSVHMGEESCTLDLSSATLTPTQVEQAEWLANQIVWENRTVKPYFVSSAQAEQLHLRKLPPVTGKIRLIDIDKFDLTACGGTHVARTGEVGLIKVVKLERYKEGLRVEFRCGRRALLDYRLKNNVANRLAAALTTSYTGIEPAVQKLQAELKQSQRLLKKQQTDLLAGEAARLLRDTPRKGKTQLICQVYSEWDAGQVRLLAKQLTQNPEVIALLGVAGEKAQLIFARSEDGPGNMSDLLKMVLPLLGAAAGGGNATFAQGGGPPADLARLSQALSRAEKLILAQM
ncbi:MAG: alanyl-tRNA editing protein [Anaerolineae bacterium]|nr:alanyl-tRNA editing protein [Anaerolineae bacterium]